MNIKLVVFAAMAGGLMFALTSFVTRPEKKTLYDFTAKTIDGKDFDFSSLKGKKVMIVILHPYADTRLNMPTWKSFTSNMAALTLPLLAFLPITLGAKSRAPMLK